MSSQAPSRVEAAEAGSKPKSGLTTLSPIYTNQFVIQVEGGEEEARKLASKHGFVYLNHILDDYYHLEHRRLSKRSLSLDQDALNISIQDEPQVSYGNEEIEKKKKKIEIFLSSYLSSCFFKWARELLEIIIFALYFLFRALKSCGSR